jgi:hypothetical protein
METRTCKSCSAQFVLDGEDLGFLEKVGAPLPLYCPQCRAQRRLAHRNERTMYKRKCNLCDKDIVAIYPSETPWPVYCAPCWWSDNWAPQSFAQDFDTTKPFFEQYRELQNKVPRIGLLSIQSVNSEYTNNAADNKNCYILFAAEKNEDCYYGRLVQSCKSVVDAAFVYESELCYECVDCVKCYNTLFSERCQASSDLLFCFDVRDSSHCILSTNLRHKSYCIENVQYSKEEYEQKRKAILSSWTSIEAAKKRFEELKGQTIVKYAFQTKCNNATGDYLYNCHEGRMLFDTRNTKHCRFLADAEDPTDSWDMNNAYYKPELCYDVMGVLQVYNCKHCSFVFYAHDMEYCNNCYNSENCFGCIGLRKGQYCILNKAYTPEEYARLKSEIIASLKVDGSYGQFIPPEFSPFGYNETLAKDFWALTKEEAHAKGFKWQEATTGTFGKETIKKGMMPATIDEVQDNILNDILVCERCNKNFRLTAGELQFYRKMHLPIPRYDFECRHQMRMAKRTPRSLWHRNCRCSGAASDNGLYQNTGTHVHNTASCAEEFETAYANERPEIVYCEACYQSEVV